MPAPAWGARSHRRPQGRGHEGGRGAQPAALLGPVEPDQERHQHQRHQNDGPREAHGYDDPEGRAVSFTSAVCVAPARLYCSCSVLPGTSASTAELTSSGTTAGRFWTWVTTSPGRRPAIWAGLPGTTEATSTPPCQFAS